MTTALGACALDLDGTGDRAYLLSGARGPRADASLRAVASTRGELFVEIHDATPGPDDRVQLWTTTEDLSYSAQCLPRSRAAPKQWQVRALDGKVIAPRASDLVVARAGASGVTRLRIELPKGARGVTIAYADADRGRIKRVFASSRVARGAPESLGRVFAVSEEQARCRVQGGALEIAPGASITSPDTPFLRK